VTAAPRVVPILVYHAVSDHAPTAIAPFTVTPAALRRQLEHVIERGATALTVSQLAALRRGGDLPPHPVVITFDDGWADFACVESVLARYEIPATLYVTTGFVDRHPATLARLGAGPRDALSWSEVRDVAARGIEVGAHSRTHPQLDAIPRRAAVAEIVDSRHRLEDELQRAVRTFAYPHGYSNTFVRRAVAQNGFDAACAVRNAFSSTRDDVFALARLTVRATTPSAVVGAWIDGQGADLASERVRVRTHAWRTYRRARHALETVRTGTGP
jgi:peptidoglycan/xylan/chitin deacetylase (PgdA/CDA1 family)